MESRRSQQGMSVLGILAILIMVGFFAMCAIRMAPPYFEYLSVKNIIEDIVTDPETPDSSLGDIRRRISNIFNTNQIYEVDPKSVEIYRKKGNTYIDAGYEVRVPIMWRIDAVMDFEDLRYQVGDATPLDRGAMPKR